jgi:hypothetical protein
LFSVDGTDVPVRFSGNYRALLGEGAPFGPAPAAFSSCAPVRLVNGEHALDSARSTRVHELRLTSARVAPAAPPPSGTVESRVVDRGHGWVRLRVEADGPAVVVSGQSFDPGWEARSRGRSLGPPRAMDTLAGWTTVAGGTYEVEMRYAPQTQYQRSYAFAVAGVIGSVLLIWLGDRRRRADD